MPWGWPKGAAALRYGCGARMGRITVRPQRQTVSRGCAAAVGAKNACRVAVPKSGESLMTATATQVASSPSRWVQLGLGVVAMMAISSPQYVWTLFTGPLNQRLGTTLAELQWTFSLLIILQTWLSPFQAFLVDRFGPRRLISVGAIMAGGSWVLAASVDNLLALYLTYGVIGGFGTGIIYVGIIGLM